MSTGGDRVLCGRGHTASVVVDVSMESLAQSFKQQQGMNCFLRKTHRVGTRRLREFQEKNSSSECSTVVNSVHGKAWWERLVVKL